MSPTESPVIQVLSQSTIYGTLPVLSPQGYLLSNEINYPTLNEEYVIQKIIQDYQQKKAKEKALWRIGGAVVGTLLGIGDGFQAEDLIGSFLGLNAGNLISDEIHRLDDAQLKELGLEWVNSPESYLYHKNRHRGHATRRLLLIIPHPQSNQPCTAFAIQFPDGYVAILSLLEGDNTSIFMVSSHGFDWNWIQGRMNLGSISSDVGLNFPIELWQSQTLNLVAIPYTTPHHSLY